MTSTNEEFKRNQEDRIERLEAGQKELMDMLRPISDTFRTATFIGRWTMGLLVFLSVLLGVILSIKSLK